MTTKSSTSSPSPSLATRSLIGAIYVVFLRAGARLLTFVLNNVLVRLASPEALGAASIHLDLVLNLIVALAGDGIKTAYLRSSAQTKQLALTFFPLIWSPIVSVLVFGLYYFYILPNNNNTSTTTITTSPADNNFIPCALIYILSAIIYLAALPFDVHAQANLNARLRVLVEAAALLCKTLSTILIILYFKDDSNLILFAFAAGQLIFSLITLFGFIIASASHSSLSLFKTAAKSAFTLSFVNIDTSLLPVAWALSKQSVFQLILQEADKLFVAKFSTSVDQGGYALAINYGSLCARILFQPVEEACRTYFGKLVSTMEQQEQNNKIQNTNTTIQTAFDASSALVKVYVYFSLLLITYVPPLIPSLVLIAFGNKWANTSAPRILHTYIYLLPFLGFNGIADAFVHSVLSPDEISSQSFWLICSSFTFILFAFIFQFKLKLGQESVIFATILGLCTRITYSTYLISWFWSKFHSLSFLNHHRRLYLIPNFRVLFSFIFANILINYYIITPKPSSFKQALINFIFSALLALFHLVYIFVEEKPWISSLKKLKSDRKIQ